MTEPGWLGTRTPSPPEELASAIRSALSDRVTIGDPTPMQLLEAAHALLEKVLQNECAQRESALDLLAADALVTYALEIANEKGSLGSFPELAMESLAGSK